MTAITQERTSLRGLLLIGGAGNRAWPLPEKPIQGIHGRPAFFYYLEIILKAQARDILIVCNSQNYSIVRSQLGNGRTFGVAIHYCEAHHARGPGSAFLIPKVRRFVSGWPCLVVLDGIFAGGNFDDVIGKAAAFSQGCRAICTRVHDPRPFGTFFEDGLRITKIVEKPNVRSLSVQRTWLVLTHLMLFDGTACDRAMRLQPTNDVELGVVDIIRTYHADGKLEIELLQDIPKSRLLWSDAGTPENIGLLCVDIDRRSRKGALIGFPHLVALQNNWVTLKNLKQSLAPWKHSSYARTVFANAAHS